MFGCQYKIVSKIPLDIDAYVKKNSSACGGQPPTLRQHTAKTPPYPLAKMSSPMQIFTDVWFLTRKMAQIPKLLILTTTLSVSY